MQPLDLFVLKRRHRGCIYLCNHSNMNLLSGSNMKGVSIYGQLILSLLFIRWCIIFLKKFQIIRIKADSPLTRLSALNSSRHIQFHYYLISSEPDNFLSYHNLYFFVVSDSCSTCSNLWNRFIGYTTEKV